MIKYTRQQALAIKYPRHFGSICSKHPYLQGERFVSGSCITCATERNQRYRATNPKRTQKNQINSQRTWKIKLKTNAALREKKALRDAKYRAKNKEHLAAYKRAWGERYPGRTTAYATRRKKALKQRTPKWLTLDDFWMMEQAYELAALRTKVLKFPWHVDHIIPLQGKNVSGLHVPANLRVIPAVMNRSKWNKFEENA